ERQPWYVARRAADLLERLFATQHRPLDLRVTRNDTSWHLQRGLEHRHGGDVGAGEFVGKAVPAGVGVPPPALGGLDAVMVIKRRVGELAERDDVAGLVPRANHETGWIVGVAGEQTESPQPLHL